MDLVQSRIVTDDVQRLAAFYARLVRVPVVLNDYYVEVPAGAMPVGFSRRRFTEYREDQAARPGWPRRSAEIILDFQAGDVDAEYRRIAGLGVDWVAPPATQPWGNRSMTFRDPAGNLVNILSPHQRHPGSLRMTGQQDLPENPAEAARRDGTALAHMLIVSDIQRAVRFYRDVLDAAVIREGEPSILRLCHGWLILNVGGGPTPDKPDVTMTAPADPASVSSALNIRVADVAAVYRAWGDRGARFLTEPVDHGWEIRCYLRDPDGHLIEVGQTPAT